VPQLARQFRSQPDSRSCTVNIFNKFPTVCSFW
jgi:hypothetical protein